LAQLEGRLLDARQVETVWAAELVKVRDAVLAIPSRVAPQFSDPRHAETIVRRECEIALRTLSGHGG
jgi:hypothetical protein